MKYGSERSAVIIQARMTSRRFPGKMLSVLGGMPLVEYVYRRRGTSSVKRIIVATSDDRSDDGLYGYCEEHDIPAVRGSLDNVLERYIRAAELLNVAYIGRVCGDTPFVDISLLEAMLDTLIRKRLDYVSLARDACASGFWSEVVTLQALKKAARLTGDRHALEHVTKFIIENPDTFRNEFMEVDLNPDFVKDVRLTIDYPEDLVRANDIVRALSDPLSFTSQDILNIVNRIKEEEHVEKN